MLENIHLSGHVGNIDLIDYPHTAFLCSRNVPTPKINAIIEWAQNVTDSSVCMVCGFQTSVEYQVVRSFILNKVPVIIVFSTAIPEITDKELLSAIDDGLLLILSQCSEEKPSSDAYQERNALILELSDHIIVGYCTRGGNIAKQLFGRKNVTHITSYSEYDNQDCTLWSRSLRLTDGGTIILNLRTLNKKNTYLELTKAFYSQESHQTEYTTTYIPENDLDSLNSLLSEAAFMQKNYHSQQEYKINHTNNHPPIAAEELMPWEEDVKIQIVRMHHEGVSIEKIASNLNVSRTLIEGILGIEA